MDAQPIAQPAPTLTFSQALTSPCASCDAFCCSYLPLQVVPVRNLMEVDYLRFLLGFPHLRAGFSIGGQWSVYYSALCRQFDAGTRRCLVYGTVEQPKTCIAYNEHDCWYQRAINSDSDGFLLFDRRRLEQLLPLMTFDTERNIQSVPSWNEMVDLCSRYPLPHGHDGATNGADCTPLPLPSRRDAASPTRTLSDLLQDPCEQCEAPCCRYLYFPLPVAETFMQIDHVKFCLNFPGIECAITPVSWWLLLRADCEFFQPDERRCQLYGKPERPLRCVHLNQWDCGQYRQLLDPDSGELLRYDRDGFAGLCEQFRFDDDGRITHFPNLFNQ